MEEKEIKEIAIYNKNEIEKNLKLGVTSHLKFFLIHQLLYTTIFIKISKTKHFKNFFKCLKQFSFKNIEENTLLFSLGIKLIDLNEYLVIKNVWLNYRNQNSIAHSFNNLLKDFEIETVIEEIDKKIKQINNREIVKISRSVDLNEVNSSILIFEIFDENKNIKICEAYNNKNKSKPSIKEAIDNINNKDVVFDFFIQLLIEKSETIFLNNSKKKVIDILKIISNETKNKLLIRLKETTFSFHSYKIFNEILEIDEELINKNIILIEDIVKKWQNEQNDYYEFKEINFILKSKLFYKMIDRKWIHDKRSNLIDFYKWVVFDGNKNGLLAYNVEILEKYMLNIFVLKSSLETFYRGNKYYIVNRLNKKFLCDEMKSFLDNFNKELFV